LELLVGLVRVGVTRGVRILFVFLRLEIYGLIHQACYRVETFGFDIGVLGPEVGFCDLVKCADVVAYELDLDLDRIAKVF